MRPHEHPQVALDDATGNDATNAVGRGNVSGLVKFICG
jgi:hypothetical protein